MSATSSVVNMRRLESLRGALIQKLLSKYNPGCDCFILLQCVTAVCVPAVVGNFWGVVFEIIMRQGEE